jgi:hypothetical protein
MFDILLSDILHGLVFFAASIHDSIGRHFDGYLSNFSFQPSALINIPLISTIV